MIKETKNDWSLGFRVSELERIEALIDKVALYPLNAPKLRKLCQEKKHIETQIALLQSNEKKWLTN